MSTAECLEAIIDMWDSDGSPKDWRRLSKKKIGFDVVREFENRKTGETIYYLSRDEDDEDGSVVPSGEVYFYVSEKPQSNPWGSGPDMWLLAFNPKSYWEKEECLWDQHYGQVLGDVYGVPGWIIEDEASENQFIVPTTRSREEIIEALEAVPGLSQNEKFSKFMARWE